jgi:hypothetical protein
LLRHNLAATTSVALAVGSLVLDSSAMLNVIDTGANVAVCNLALTAVLLVAPVVLLITGTFAGAMVALV